MTLTQYKDKKRLSYRAISKQTGIPLATLWRIAQNRNPALIHALKLVTWSDGAISLEELLPRS
jgi:predicted transcriptional regulator